MLRRHSPLQRTRPLAKVSSKDRVRSHVRKALRRSKGVRPTAEERRHMDRVAALGCLVSGKPATLHHVTSDGFKRIARSHRRVVPLAPEYHLIQHGPQTSVEALGHAGFTATYGIDLFAEGDRLWAESERIESER